MDMLCYNIDKFYYILSHGGALMKKRFAALFIALLLVFTYTIANAQITQLMYYGASGSQVTELQNNLKTLGLYTGTADGNYNYSTYLAVKAFQTKYSLPVTGNFDLTVLNKMNKVLAGEPDILKYGITADRVRELQTYLYSLGYLSVAPTGFYGSLTTAGVSKLQSDTGLSITGQADSAVFTKVFELIDKKYTPYKTYAPYTVVSGDNLWAISNKFGVTQSDLMTANNFTSSTVLSIGQVIRIPKVNVPVKPTYYKYGEYLNWFSSAQYVFPIGTDATVIDYFSGKSFKIRRTIGSGHADCEPLTANDTAIMKDIFGGKWAWTDRPIIIVVNGRRIAASMAGMPHAGLDSAPANAVVSNLSGGYGTGVNYDYIKGNNMDGHFDIHLPGSLRHKDWQVDPEHQAMIKISSNR
jgi:peptidoglycan hydrolase-like protein with peptidoglycan-binding domain